MGLPDKCRVVGCGRPQQGEPLCETHWRHFFGGYCMVDACDIKPRGDDAFACQRHVWTWQRADDRVTPTAETAEPVPPTGSEASGRGCTMANCHHSHYARGFCQMHYRRWNIHGDPTIVLKSGRKPGAP
ncbi:hypothetical protein [Mycobacterium sp. 94-17]|uniref:hypothetical protein n=1 Tax=Mycobacterium sp. 94-17 TaxID=2986147 RepID=UPI002D1EF595|nr:hypothetical protein [Mycobacterium sp. 94-17]MEB4212325.1 hypothetical protein [Mycobacterium sp. 94-17]